MNILFVGSVLMYVDKREAWPSRVATDVGSGKFVGEKPAKWSFSHGWQRQ